MDSGGLGWKGLSCMKSCVVLLGLGGPDAHPDFALSALLYKEYAVDITSISYRWHVFIPG